MKTKLPIPRQSGLLFMSAIYLRLYILEMVLEFN